MRTSSIHIQESYFFILKCPELAIFSYFFHIFASYFSSFHISLISHSFSCHICLLLRVLSRIEYMVHSEKARLRRAENVDQILTTLYTKRELQLSAPQKESVRIAGIGASEITRHGTTGTNSNGDDGRSNVKGFQCLRFCLFWRWCWCG